MADGEEPGDVQRPVSEDADSIWRNDAIPVRDEPLDIVWAKRPASNDNPVSPAPPPSAFQPLELAHGDAPPERHRRSKLLIAGGVLVTLAIVVSVMVRAGGDEAAVPGTTTEATGPSTTSDAPATTDGPHRRGCRRDRWQHSVGHADRNRPAANRGGDSGADRGGGAHRRW